MSLEKDDIVIAGTCVTPVMVSLGDEVLADFSNLGLAKVRFK